MLSTVNLILFITAVSLIITLLLTSRRDSLITNEVSLQLDEVLNDKEYLSYLKDVEKKEIEKKVLVYQSYSIRKIGG